MCTSSKVRTVACKHPQANEKTTKDYLVKVIKPLLSPTTESCKGSGQSNGEKKKTLSSSWPQTYKPT
jgi:hypothetical protein